MSNNDFLSRFLFDDTDIRGEIVTLEKSFQKAYAHQTIPDALLPIFGDFLAGATLLSEVLKFEGILTLQARSDSDIAIVMAEVNDQGHLRGVLRLKPESENQINFEDLSLTTLLNNGVLTITIDPNKGKRYQGIVPINGETLAACLEEYFKQSEQLPTQIQLFSNKEFCGGLFLQCLPAQLITDSVQREDAWETCTQLAATLSQDELYSLQNEEVLLRLFHEVNCRVFPAKAMHFNCSCDRERSANALQSIGYEEALALVRERDIINIDCQFCGKIYSFGEKELAEIFPRGGSSLH